MNDTEIVKLYLDRSDTAIAETATKYGPYLSRIAYNILCSPEDSEEVVSDTYLRAWNSIPPQIPRVLKHFLSRITRNLSLNRLEYLNAGMRSPEFNRLIEELEPGICSVHKSAESEWEQKYVGELVNSFLATRKINEQRVFVCRYYYFMTLREIAEKLSVPEHRIRYMLSKMASELKNYLEKEDAL